MALIASLLAVGAAVLAVVGVMALYRHAGSSSGGRSSGSTPGRGSDDVASADTGDDDGRQSSPTSGAPSPDGDSETEVAKEYRSESDGTSGGSTRDGETEVANSYLSESGGSGATSGESTEEATRCSACGSGVSKTDAVCPACDAIVWSDCDVLLDGDGMAIELDGGGSVGPAIRRTLSRAGVPDDETLRVSTEHLAFRARGSGIEVCNCTTDASALELDGRALEPDAWTPVSDKQQLTVAGQFEFTVRIPE